MSTKELLDGAMKLLQRGRVRPQATIRSFRIVQTEGSREISRIRLAG